MGYPTQSCPCTQDVGSQYPRHSSEARKALLSERQPSEKAGSHSQGCLALSSQGTALCLEKEVNAGEEGFLKPLMGEGWESLKQPGGKHCSRQQGAVWDLVHSDMSRQMLQPLSPLGFYNQ